MPKLLVVDDDLDLLAHLRANLTAEHYIVDTAVSGEDALQVMGYTEYDAIVLDWSLPDLDGLGVCKRIRQMGSRVPILFLTGHSGITHKESGLDAGADDYLTKPFEYRELAARLRSLIRRSTNRLDNTIVLNNLTYDPGNLLLSYANGSTRLTLREGALLEYLLKNTDVFFMARELRDKVWPSDSTSTDESVRTCMKTLRQKLTGIGLGDLVKTVKGAGYIVESKQ